MKKIIFLLLFAVALLCLFTGCKKEETPEPKSLTWAFGTDWPTAEDFYPDLENGATVRFADESPFPKNMMTKTYTVNLIYKSAKGTTAKKTATLDVTIDKEAPTISGVHVIAIYIGEAVAYRDGITITDDCDGTVSLSIDASKVDVATAGEYAVTYTATDRTGKSSTAETKVCVYDNKITEDMLWEKLDPIIEKLELAGQTKVTQVQIIWDYVHDKKNVSYQGTSDKGDWVRGAYDAITKKAGDCFTYFSLSKAFFERLGIANLDIYKPADSGEANSHYWSMVNVGTESQPVWYYYDATRVETWIKRNYETYLLTASQMAILKEERPDLYGTDLSSYPATSAKEYTVID